VKSLEMLVIIQFNNCQYLELLPLAPSFTQLVVFPGTIPKSDVFDIF